MSKLTYKRANFIMETYEQEQKKAAYREEKTRRESSPQYIRSENSRSLIKKMTEINNELANVRLKAFNDMSVALMNFIKADLSSVKEPTYEQALEIVTFYKRNFLDLEELSNGSNLSGNFNEPYDKFFIELMKLNPYFIYFARPKTFEIANVPFSRFSEKYRLKKLLPHLKSLNLFENEKFLNRYGKYFEIKDNEKTLS